jgi:thioredoxin-like negative regulator of GroEL
MRNFTLLFLSITVLGASFTWAQDPENSRIAYLEAMESRNYREAMQIAEAAVLEDSLDLDARTKVARSAIKLGKFKQAEEVLTEVLEIDSTFIPARFYYARMLESIGKTEMAAESYAALSLIDTTNYYYPFLAAEASFRTGDFMNAILFHKQSLERNAENLDSYIALSRILIEVGAFFEADSLLEIASNLESGEQKTLLFKAKSAFLQEDYERVNALFDSIPNLEDQLEAAFRYYGISLYHTDRTGEAIQILSQLSNINDELDYPHYYKGLCFLKMGSPEYAEVQFRQAALKAQSPNLSTYYHQMAKSQQLQGDHESALANFKLARHFDNSASLAYDMALSIDAYYRDKTMALKAFEEYLEISDTMASLERNYAESRIDALKKELHFQNIE